VPEIASHISYFLNPNKKCMAAECTISAMCELIRCGCRPILCDFLSREHYGSIQSWKIFFRTPLWLGSTDSQKRSN